jgi:HlyD family secretion protein
MTFSLKKNSNRLMRYFPWLFAVILLISAVWYLNRSNPINVKFVTVERGVVEAAVSNTRAGTVKACRRAKLSAPAGGLISKLRVVKGDRVKRDQVLLELWNDDMQAQKQLAEDQLTTTISQSKEACTIAETALRAVERAQTLRAQGFVSQEALERTLSTATARQASCESARSAIAQSKSRIAVAQASLQRMVLRAPFSGIVADISGELGEYATPSPPGILTLPTVDLIDDSCMFVSAPIDEVDAANIELGQVARITLDAIKGKSFPGKVRRIAPYVLELEKQARTVEVEVGFVDLPVDENLLIGYSADVEIVYDSRENVLRIPTQTLLEGKYVLRNANGVLENRTVTTGLFNWDQTEITDGLSEGDQIVMSLDRDGVEAGTIVQSEVFKPEQ